MKGRPGPRQPLSRQRPKLSLEKGRSARAAKSTSRGPPPSSGKIGQGTRPTGTKFPLTASPQRGAKRPARSRRPTAHQLPAYAAEVYRRLLASYPDAHCELDHASPFQLLVATILSAQCTDRRVNMVTPALFAKYPTPGALAAAPRDDLEEAIKSTGFFRNKSRSLLGMSQALVDRFGGRVPASMADLVTLPGVGRKTANVVLGNAFNVDSGVVVDTHVQRLSARLGLTTNDDPLRIEQDLMRLFPETQWTMLAHLLIWHGRRVCEAKRPKCEMCVLADFCPSSTVR